MSICIYNEGGCICVEGGKYVQFPFINAYIVANLYIESIANSFP